VTLLPATPKKSRSAMKQMSKLSKLQLGFAVAALLSSMALTSTGIVQAVNASPYHMDRLPDGTVTGPIAPNTNGG